MQLLIKEVDDYIPDDIKELGNLILTSLPVFNGNLYSKHEFLSIVDDIFKLSKIGIVKFNKESKGKFEYNIKLYLDIPDTIKNLPETQRFYTDIIENILGKYLIDKFSYTFVNTDMFELIQNQFAVIEYYLLMNENIVLNDILFHYLGIFDLSVYKRVSNVHKYEI